MLLQATMGDSAMTDAPKLSDLSVDKMQAILGYDCSDPDSELGPPAYRAACKAWFEALSDENITIVQLAAEAFEDGDPARAERIAALLPPAPKYPLE